MTMENVYLTVTDVMTMMTVETTVMKGIAVLIACQYLHEHKELIS